MCHLALSASIVGTVVCIRAITYVRLVCRGGLAVYTTPGDGGRGWAIRGALQRRASAAVSCIGDGLRLSLSVVCRAVCMAVRVVLLSRCRVHGRVSTLCVRVESEAELTAIDHPMPDCDGCTAVGEIYFRHGDISCP